MNNTISIPDGHIVIQSCDADEAHIGVFIAGRGIYRHVSVPSLTRCRFENDRPGQMTSAEFDAVLTAHHGAVVARLAALNSAALPLFAEAQ